MIAFVGSVFSPYYWLAGHRAPEDHVCINLCLYGPRRHHWAMTERGRGALERDAGRFRVGPSQMSWDGTRLTLDFDERASPFPRVGPYPMRGRVVLEAEALGREGYALDAAGRHAWRPLAPMARVAVQVAEPALAWAGHGYLDSNWGTEMLEAGFRRWDWSRAQMGDGSAAILYDMEPRAGEAQGLALRIRPDGAAERFTPPPRRRLPRGWWGVARATQAEGPARLVRGLEDSPFYTRAEIETELLGERVPAMHETFDGRRFASPVVKAMLPMRMPRKRRWPR
ncbi:MAG: carotenoid 1,2-hydratase [Pseudomonadota bacterium]